MVDTATGGRILEGLEDTDPQKALDFLIAAQYKFKIPINEIVALISKIFVDFYQVIYNFYSIFDYFIHINFL